MEKLHEACVVLQSAQKEKAAKEAAAAEADATSDGKTLGDYVVSIFEIPPLSFLQGPLEPLLDTIRDNTIVAAAVALGLATIPLFILSSLLSSKVAFCTSASFSTILIPFDSRSWLNRLSYMDV